MAMKPKFKIGDRVRMMATARKNSNLRGIGKVEKIVAGLVEMEDSKDKFEPGFVVAVRFPKPSSLIYLTERSLKRVS